MAGNLRLSSLTRNFLVNFENLGSSTINKGLQVGTAVGPTIYAYQYCDYPSAKHFHLQSTKYAVVSHISLNSCFVNKIKMYIYNPFHFSHYMHTSILDLSILFYFCSIPSQKQPVNDGVDENSIFSDPTHAVIFPFMTTTASPPRDTPLIRGSPPSPPALSVATSTATSLFRPISTPCVSSSATRSAPVLSAK